MSSSQVKRLDDWIKVGPITIPTVSSSFNNITSQQEEVQVEPWRIKSYYLSDTLQCYYHLHPELVDIDDGGVEYTFLCPRCYKEYKEDKCYKLSIAAGIDFGNYQRITELEHPNLHEQIILSLNRLYSVRIKVMPNGKGFMQTHGMNKIRGNQILFHHDCVIKVNHEALQESDYDDDLVVFI